ncbi:SufE family protein [Candidatus Rhodoluna planktonica]|uniref:Cysteine desufuration protein SufE n=1 Tax=Candidatus Rhodoluna planktonica TaxID=535712 RepID=A0A1D9DYZ4_9MICO|nr:SufE family protein [Candidatus Rhodoluna planktonica]AOY56025.1 cysteine desufuration protein SufE [Candidatus Rhodoluna planktonica]
MPVEDPKSLIEDFQSVSTKEKLDLLLEFSENLPQLPARYVDHPDLLERVEECQSPIYLFVEVLSDGNKTVNLFFTAPEESPTTRGFASILHSVLDGLPASQVQAFDDDFPSKLGLAEAVSPLRMRGMRGMLSRIKRQVSEKSS